MVSYKVILERNDDEAGYYTATVPALPGCVSQGRTTEEALEHVREAIRGYLESLQKDGISTPRDESWRNWRYLLAELELLIPGYQGSSQGYLMRRRFQ